MDWYDPLIELSPLSKNLSIKASAALWRAASLGVSFPSAHPVPGVHFTQAFPGLIRSALKVFHLFSGLLLLEPIEFISSRSAHGISPSELSPLRDWSLLSKSLTLLLLAAALTGCLALPVLPRVLQRQVCSSTSGCCSLLKLVHIKSGFRWFYGRCSLGFQSSLGFCFFVGDHIDHCGCGSCHSPAL